MIDRQWVVTHFPPWFIPYLRSIVIWTTRAIGAAMRGLPGTSRSFGPPRHIVPTLRDYAAYRQAVHADDAYYTELYSSHLVSRSMPITVDERVRSEFLIEKTHVLPAAGIAEIERGRVVSVEGFISGVAIGPTDHFIGEASAISGIPPDGHPVFLLPKLPPVKKVDGTVAVLASQLCLVYGHWIADTLPRLHLIEQCGIPYDKIVVPYARRYHKEVLELFGVDSSKMIIDPNLHIEARRLIVPTLPGAYGSPPAWACQFLRERALKHRRASATPRRVLISRNRPGLTRSITNEDELFAVLRPWGFERVFVEDLTFVDEISLFNNAEIIIGGCGSGMVNVMWCSPGATVIELFNPNYVNVMSWAIANQLGLRYGYVVGPGQDTGELGTGVHENITVDVAKVRELVERIGIRAYETTMQ